MKFQRKILVYLIISLLSLSQSVAFAKVEINNYKQTFIPLYDQDNHFQLAIRMYDSNGEIYFLCVDPNTLQTKVLLAEQAQFRGEDSKGLRYFKMEEMIQNTPYMKLLSQFSAPPYKIENHGLIKVVGDIPNVFLTVDLCPSRNSFEKRLFLALIEKANKLSQPFPVAISISGLWMVKYKQDFIWLLENFKTNKLKITWVNHSFSHPYYVDLPDQENFLRVKPKNFKQEILMTERLLLEYGQLPSVYFRFPGLVADENLILHLKELGLIALGSDAWLAKGEKPQNGSIILIHGNGNEPSGVDRFLELIKHDDLQFQSLNTGVLAMIRAANLSSQ